MLPTFFVIGAPKAGTSSLHEYLAAHPDIAMTTVKEPMCFEPPDWRERLPEYSRLFPHQAAVRGESSTAYSSYPWVPEIPDRVRAEVPDARIVYVVRDPIPRLLSHYAQNLWDNKRVRPFDELMADLEHPRNMPVWCSRFATQLERWRERFGPEQILVLDQTDLLLDRPATMRRVFEFLGVDSSFVSADWETEHNTAASHRVPNALHDRLGRLGKRAARVRGVRNLVTAELPRPTLSAEQRRRLEELLRPEAARLRELTGRDFENWSL